MSLQGYSARGIVREYGDVNVYQPSEVHAAIATKQAEIDSLKAYIDELWAECKIIYWPPADDKEGTYPIEHTMKARKDSRKLIEARISKHRSK